MVKIRILWWISKMTHCQIWFINIYFLSVFRSLLCIVVWKMLWMVCECTKLSIMFRYRKCQSCVYVVILVIFTHLCVCRVMEMTKIFLISCIFEGIQHDSNNYAIYTGGIELSVAIKCVDPFEYGGNFNCCFL